jgi:hypothetical protein
MVSKESIEKQMQRLGFNMKGWGRGEVRELANIILPGETIHEAVNGIYEGGFALLLSTDVRVLLVDKKPLNYLTVEDMRFDMITEIDYSHRVVGASITISAGDKHLEFRSYNQPRLRKLIGHTQHQMAEIKNKQSMHQEGQVTHLEKINEQLQTYLVEQQKQQEKLYEQLQMVQTNKIAPAALPSPPEPAKPSAELADYLFARGLLAQHEKQTGQPVMEPLVTGQEPTVANGKPAEPLSPNHVTRFDQSNQYADLLAAGTEEIFGTQIPAELTPGVEQNIAHSPPQHSHGRFRPLEVNPFIVAYSKLPQALRNRKLHIHRPSFRSHNDKQSPGTADFR